MEEFPSNSHISKEEPVAEVKTPEKIVSGEVSRAKKPLGKRFSETFFGGDAKGVAGYVLWDVLIPAAKDLIVDAGSQALERLFMGDTGRSYNRRSRSSSGRETHFNYNRVHRDRREDPRRGISDRSRSRHEFDEIILDSRAEAEEVLDRLYDIMSKYEVAKVSDLYGLVGISAEFTDEKWGWTRLSGSGVSRDRGGRYRINLPRPEPLD